MSKNFEEQFKGKTALVTGAGSGIGRATALAFAEAGANTVVCEVNEQTGQETAALIREINGECIFAQVDVMQPQQVAQMVETAVSTYGRLDFACNNAGVISVPGLLTDIEEEDWDFLMNVNLKGVWLCMKYEIPELLKQESPAIVNVASAAGLVGLTQFAAYSSSKHGVIGLTKTSALDYASTGLRINALCPGTTLTAMQADTPEAAMKQIAAGVPMQRLAQPEEMARVILFLCSENASYVTGQAIAADGALTVG